MFSRRGHRAAGGVLEPWPLSPSHSFWGLWLVIPVEIGKSIIYLPCWHCKDRQTANTKWQWHTWGKFPWVLCYVKANLTRGTRTTGKQPSVLCLFHAISCQSGLTAVKYVLVSPKPIQQKEAAQLERPCRGARDSPSARDRPGSCPGLYQLHSEGNTPPASVSEVKLRSV